MGKKVIGFLLALAMLCALLPQYVPDGMAADLRFATADTVAFAENTEFDLLENGHVLCRSAEAEAEWTAYPAQLLMVWEDALVLAAGSELRRVAMTDRTDSLCYTASAPIEGFAANGDGLFLLCGGEILRLNWNYEKTGTIPAVGVVTSLWLEGAQTLCYMVDDATIYSVNLMTGEQTSRVNHASSLEQENGKRARTLFFLRQKFPDGKYWNHANNPGAENWKNNQDGWTDIPCPRHGVVGTSLQTCNGFQPGNVQYSWQCWGYADKCGYDVTGASPATDEGGWSTSYRSASLNTLKAGDILRYRTSQQHSIYVTAVSGNTVTFTDCNYYGKCQIRWDVTISLTTLRERFVFCEIAPSKAIEGRDPVGQVETLAGVTGGVQLSGWCKDEDDLSAAVELRVSLGAPESDDGAEVHEGIMSRANDHRFDVLIPTERIGTMPVYVYAKNLQGGKDALIGSGTVDIPAPTFTLTFDPAGGTVEEQTRTVTFAGAYGRLPVPIRAYYVFDGWFAEAGQPVTAETIVSCRADHTLYAHWTHVCAGGHAYQYKVTAYPAEQEDGLLIGNCTRCPAAVSCALPALNDSDYTYRVVREPTCTRMGLANYVWSSKIHGSYTFETSIPRIPHDYTAVVTEPACTEQGYTTYTCAACGDSYVSDYVAATGHEAEDDCLYCNEEVSCGHLDGSAPVAVTEPTCTEQGYLSVICPECGLERRFSFTAALGHAWDEGMVTTEPTVISDGERTFFCTRCDQTRTEMVDALPYPFRDVREKSYCRLPVGWASMHGITNGIGAYRFGPDNACTRGQVVTMLWRAEGSPEPVESEHPFEDVAPGSFCETAVRWAVEQGITKGVNASVFGVNKPCTRAQAVTFLYRAAGSPETEANSTFSDVAENSFCHVPVCWAMERGITNGTSEAAFSPDKTCTRGQIVTFLWRALEE